MNEKNIKTAWEEIAEAVRQEIKFLPKNDVVTIYPSPAPFTAEVDGKFGKQIMYVVNTDIGNVYLNRTQFLKVVAMLSENGYKTPIRFSR